ncbi:ABC transporter permease [Arenibacter lacus]|uniref:ABC transporter permease n=1 Tax=Arenibacter lacus TaxID=2608629 RepID=UPI00123DAAC8|nr:ABC transporter permease [Arenibacter lacus]
MKQFIHLVKEEFRRIFSNDVLIAIFFGAPILYGIMFGFVYQQAKVLDLPIVIIDQDNSPASDKVIDAFGDNEALWVSDVRPLAGDIAQEMPAKGYVAVITIPSNFEADLLQKRYPEIRVDLNMGNILTANTASVNIQSVLLTLNAGIEIAGLQKQGLAPDIAAKSYEPFKINFNKLYNSTGNYVTFMLPGLLGGIMQQVIFLAMALVFARDFEDGYFSKLKGVSRNSLYHIALKSAPFLLFIPLMWLIVSRFIPFFNIDVAIYNPAMFVLVALLSLASMMIGMLFSVLIPNQLKATELLMVISTPAFILSGFTWPTMAMPDAIAHIAQYIPLTQFLSGFRKVAVYGGGIEAILPEIKWLVMIALVCFVAIVLALQTKIGWKKREIA